jgi:hypothetical protein
MLELASTQYLDKKKKKKNLGWEYKTGTSSNTNQHSRLKLPSSNINSSKKKGLNFIAPHPKFEKKNGSQANCMVSSHGIR